MLKYLSAKRLIPIQLRSEYDYASRGLGFSADSTQLNSQKANFKHGIGKSNTIAYIWLERNNVSES